MVGCVCFGTSFQIATKISRNYYQTTIFLGGGNFAPVVIILTLINPLYIFLYYFQFYQGVHTPFYHSNIQQIVVKGVKHLHKIRYKYVTCLKLIANFITYFYSSLFERRTR